MLSTERLCMGCMNDSGGEKVCPICGYSSETENDKSCLKVKTWIKNRFLVGSVIEVNGQGVTYIGWDNENNGIVEIHEYFPALISKREADGSVTVAGDNEYAFNEGIMEFLTLQRKLSKLDMESLGKVISLVEENGTAYAIVKFSSGITLREFLVRNGGSLKWDQAKTLFIPLISVINELHNNGIVHAGISPETVIVTRDGKLRLSGFAIPQLRRKSSPIHSQIYPGYAAAEQYGTSDDGVFTPATDVYGYAATLFRTLMGSAPPEASERLKGDNISIPAKIAEELPKAVLITLADALQIDRENRTANMEELKLNITPALDVTSNFSKPVKAEKKSGEKNKPVHEDRKPDSDKKMLKLILLSAGITAAILLILGVVIWAVVFRDPAAPDDGKQSVVVPVEESSESSSPEVSDPNAVTVPDFSADDKTFAELVEEYPNFNLKVQGKKYSSKSAGIVISQNVNPGTEVKKGDTVLLTVSLGQEDITVPDLTGLDINEAYRKLFEKGFIYGNIDVYQKESDDDSIGYDCVIETEPAAGKRISADSKLTVYCRKGGQTQDAHDGQ